MNGLTIKWMLIICCLIAGTFPHVHAQGSKALLDAIEQDDHKTVKSLIKKGADLNETILMEEPEYTFFISRDNYMKAIGLEKEPQFNYMTPLQFAALKNRLKIAKYLIKKRANLDARDSQGKTALMYALWHPGGEALALEFIKRGANYVARDYAGSTALHYAAFGGNSEGIHMTYGGGCDINDRNKEGITPLHAAAMMADVEILNQLADIGADVKLTDSIGMNGLHYAVAYGNANKISWFIERGVDVNAIAENGYSPLDLAQLANNEAAIKVLKENGATFQSYKLDELFKAVEGKVSFRVRELLKEGVNPNGPSDFSPLHITAKNGDLGIAEWLIKAGADVNAVSPIAGTPMEEAIKNNNPGPAILFIDNGATFPAELVPIAYQKWAEAGVKSTWEELLQRILKNQTNLDMYGGTETLTALQYAAWAGDPDQVKNLVEAGADVRLVDAKGWSALHWTSVSLNGLSSGEKKKEIAKILMDAGADPKLATTKPRKREGTKGTPTLFFPPNSTPLDVSDNTPQVHQELEVFLEMNGGNRNLTSADYVAIGYERLKNEEYPLALKDFSKAILLDMNNGLAYLGRGRAMSAQNLYKEAERDLDLAIVHRPKDAEAYYYRGVARFSQKQYFPAGEDLEKAMDLDPEMLELYWYLGQNYLKINQLPKACNTFAAGAKKGDTKSRKSYEIHCEK